MTGRFAPSPSGRMHLGNVFAALMAWLSVRSAGGEMILRIEDLDPDRCRPEYADQLKRDLEEILEAARRIMRCDVLDEPWVEHPICGLTSDELRAHSHFPQKYYDQPHFMPNFDDSPILLHLNRLRTMIRQTELAACRAFTRRKDLIQVLNRLSSLVWIFMIRIKKESSHGSDS